MKTFKQFQEGLVKKAVVGGLLAAPFVMKKLRINLILLETRGKNFNKRKKKNTKNYLEHKDKVISTNYETYY